MASGTTLLFVVFGGVAFFLPLMRKSRRLRRIGAACAVVGVTAALVLLVCYFLDIHPEFEHWAFSPTEATGASPKGLMSPLTAFCFLIAGGAFLSHLISSGRSPTAKISFLLSCFLLLLSMTFIAAYVMGSPLLYGSGVLPPALPTSLTFLFLGAALLPPTVERLRSSEPKGDVSRRRVAYGLILIFVMSAAGIVLAGDLYFRSYTARFRAEVEGALAAVADMKVRELVHWRKERMGDAAVFFDNPDFSELVRRYLDDPKNSDAKGRIQVWLDAVRDSGRYDRVSLLDVVGHDRINSPATPDSVIPHPAHDVSAVLHSDRVSFLDFHRHTPNGPICLAVMAPIIDVSENRRPLGVLVFRIDPGEYLYPLIRRWPTPAKTAETLLVRREGDDVLFLNDLKFRDNAAFNLRFSVDLPDLPAARAVRGEEGAVEGKDYRDVPVVAAIRAIPGSPWFLVARMDRSEVYAPARERLWIVIVIVGLLLLASGVSVGALWRYQSTRFERERMESAEALERSETTIRAIFDGARDGILTADAKTRKFTAANEAICRMLGYSREELFALGVEDIHPVEQIPYVLDQFRRLVEGEITFSADIPVQRRDGSLFFAEVGATPVELDGRQCLIGIFRDATDRRLAESRILHLNAVLRGVRSVNRLITREKDRESLIRQACDLLVEARGFHSVVIGLTDDDGDGISAYAAAGDVPESLRELLERKEPPELPLEAMAGGEVAPFRSQRDPSLETGDSDCGEDDAVAVGLEQGGKILGFMLAYLPEGIKDDPEEQDLLREAAGDIAFALRGMEIEAERDQSAAALSDREEQLRQAQKLEAIGRLAGGVAHDFNNLLTLILGYADAVMQELHTDDTLREDVEEILHAARRATSLTTRLLAFSRKQTLQPEILDLNEVVANVEKMLRRLIGEDIELRTVHAEGLGKVKADPGQIEQVIMNLAVNARDAMPQGGILTIETADVQLDEGYMQLHVDVTPGPHVMLALSDNGGGMDEKTKRRLFEPFFTTKGKGKGTGLGLAMVYGIVKQSGGSIRVYSEPGEGTTFKIYLPRVEAEALSKPKSPSRAGRGGGELVMVVEDEDSLRDLFGKMLENLGYRVIAAANGAEALSLFEEREVRPDLLLTDVVMPGMSGSLLAERLQSMQPELRVIYMSGYTDDTIVHHGVLDPGTPFLQKPFAGTDLAAKIKELMSEKE